MAKVVYRVGVVGRGVIGQALVDYLETKTSHRVFCLDPDLGYHDDLTNTDIVFIGVPVPTKSFQQDLTQLKDAIASVPEGRPIVVRSTVLPGTCEELAKEFERSISHVPEFLSEGTALADLINAKFLYLGLAEGSLQSAILTIVQSIFEDKQVLPVGIKEAEMIKIIHVNYALLKLTFFETMFNLCKQNKIDYNIARLAVTHCSGLISEEGTHFTEYNQFKETESVEAFIGFLNQKNQLASKLFQDAYCLRRLYRRMEIN